MAGFPDDVRIEPPKGQDTVAEKPKIKDEHVIITVKISTNSGMKVLTDFLGDTDLKALMSDDYNANTFLDGEIETTDHLICMAHAKVKFSKAC